MRIIEDIEFLRESNYIEGERSVEALASAGLAWKYARHSGLDLNISYIKGIHYRLMEKLDPRIAGKIRETQIEVIEGYLSCLEPEKIEEYLHMWVKENPESEEEIKKLHVLFNIIHPFEDGNGRVSRILMNVQRLNIDLPVLVIKESEKEKYYEWFK